MYVSFQGHCDLLYIMQKNVQLFYACLAFSKASELRIFAIND